ncbi:hypothetical protein ACEN9X_05475 [Mucilaginibacter sp. Mucisp86]|uniref:nSTAND1 domain-containing NTPase n=1 Tax=Mucilaginibacter sp. Mucisp86 TaxID=3243060 RepID=UPI0039B6CE26
MASEIKVSSQTSSVDADNDLYQNEPPFEVDEFYWRVQYEGSKLIQLSPEAIAECPFPGMRPFKTTEHELFYGRDNQVKELLKRLDTNNFLAVLGSSGSGKSSLVRAGLIPALFGGRISNTGSDWKIVICRPGRDPIKNLSVAFANIDFPEYPEGENLNERYKREILEKSDKLEVLLQKSTFGILEVFDQLLHEKQKLLIIIDQFEELFRFDRKELKSKNISKRDIEQHFVKLLRQASSGLNPNIYLVTTMRSEFLGECVKFRGLPEDINKSQYLVPQLERDQVRKVINGPITRSGWEIDQSLTEMLVNEIENGSAKDNQDQLPILQHALMRTFKYAVANHPENKRITNYDYEKIGGIKEAIEWHAEEVFTEIGKDAPKNKDGLSEKQEIAKIIFQALTDASSEEKGGRRPTELVNIYNIAKVITSDTSQINDVINEFRAVGTSFIMPPPDTDLHRFIMLDIVHESLMRNWLRLKDWAKQEAENADRYNRLDERRKNSEDLSRFLLNGLIRWRDEEKHNAYWALRYQKIDEEDKQKSDTEIRQLKLELYKKNIDYLTAEEDKAEQSVKKEAAERRRTFTRRIISVAGGIIGLILLIAIIQVRDQKRAAEDASASFRITFSKFYNGLSLDLQKKAIKLLKPYYLYDLNEKERADTARIIKSLNIAVSALADSGNITTNLALARSVMALKIDSNEVVKNISQNILKNYRFYQQQFSIGRYSYSYPGSIYLLDSLTMVLSDARTSYRYRFAGKKLEAVDTIQYLDYNALAADVRRAYTTDFEPLAIKDNYYDKEQQMFYFFSSQKIYKRGLVPAKTKSVDAPFKGRFSLACFLPGERQIIFARSGSAKNATESSKKMLYDTARYSLYKCTVDGLNIMPIEASMPLGQITVMKSDLYRNRVILGWKDGSLGLLKFAKDRKPELLIQAKGNGPDNGILDVDISKRGLAAVLTRGYKIKFFNTVDSNQTPPNPISLPSTFGGDIPSKIIISPDGHFVFLYGSWGGILYDLSDRKNAIRYAFSGSYLKGRKLSVDGFYSAVFINNSIITISTLGLKVWQLSPGYENATQAFNSSSKPYLSLYDGLTTGLITLDDVKKSEDVDDIERTVWSYFRLLSDTTRSNASKRSRLDTITRLNEQMKNLSSIGFRNYVENNSIITLRVNAIDYKAGGRDYKKFIQRLQKCQHLLNIDTSAINNGNRALISSEIVWYQILSKDFESALQTALKSSNEKRIKTIFSNLNSELISQKSLAVALIVLKRYNDAEAIINKYAKSLSELYFPNDTHYGNSQFFDSFNDALQKDIESLEKEGIIQSDDPEISKIKKKLTIAKTTVY